MNKCNDCPDLPNLIVTNKYGQCEWKDAVYEMFYNTYRNRPELLPLFGDSVNGLNSRSLVETLSFGSAFTVNTQYSSGGLGNPV